ncbi:MAG TPA: lytic transglycosylase domain-containing protein [Burkholderiaceae bacterium]|jgi:soluble lytic murein transglycosylase-like protein
MLRPISTLLLFLFASFSYAENGNGNTRANYYRAEVASASPDYREDRSQVAAPKPKIYKYVVGGVTSFSDIAPTKGAYVVWSASCYACNLSSNINWHSTKLHLQEFSDVIRFASQKYEVDPALVRAVIHAESGFNTMARSRKGAIGLMQLMPSTARVVGVDARVPEHNIRGGVKYLATLLTQFKGNVKLAIAAYNAGPAAVEKYGGVPPFAETQAYVERVGILHQRYKSNSTETQ